MAQLKTPTKLDRALAKICVDCPVCRKARQLVVNNPVPIMLATTNAVALQNPTGRLLALPTHGARSEPAATGGSFGSGFTLLDFGQAGYRPCPS